MMCAKPSCDRWMYPGSMLSPSAVLTTQGINPGEYFSVPPGSRIVESDRTTVLPTLSMLISASEKPVCLRKIAFQATKRCLFKFRDCTGQPKLLQPGTEFLQFNRVL